MKIRFLNSPDVVAYRDLRLQALTESPTAFRSSYEQEACLPLTDFAARLRPHDDSVNCIFGAFDNSDRLIGMLGFSREIRPKRAHIGSLWSMYVLPEFRSRGIGAALLDEAIAHARQLGILRQVLLTVTANNLAARSLYKSRGFKCFGFERDALFIDGIYYDEEHLALHFDREP
jgi:ribosomal protein S18 acetylase RimI-like enzyme